MAVPLSAVHSLPQQEAPFEVPASVHGHPTNSNLLPGLEQAANNGNATCASALCAAARPYVPDDPAATLHAPAQGDHMQLDVAAALHELSSQLGGLAEQVRLLQSACMHAGVIGSARSSTLASSMSRRSGSRADLNSLRGSVSPSSIKEGGPDEDDDRLSSLGGSSAHGDGSACIKPPKMPTSKELDDMDGTLNRGSISEFVDNLRSLVDRMDDSGLARGLFDLADAATTPSLSADQRIMNRWLARVFDASLSKSASDARLFKRNAQRDRIDADGIALRDTVLTLEHC